MTFCDNGADNKACYKTHTHMYTAPYTVAVSPSKDLINFTSFPIFVFI